jgi:nicotinamidase-related amidase
VSEVPFTADASAAALLVVDLQNDFVREGAPQEVPDARATLPVVKALLEACRDGRVPVMFTRYTSGPHAAHLAWFSPECCPPTRSCWPGVTRRYRDRPVLLEGHQIVEEVAPLPDELVVDKYGYGSFHNTLLEDALRAARANQVWVVGTVTQICVEETVREGFRRGFEMVVAADGVSSFDDELHRATLRNLAQKFALVSDTVALMKTLTDTPRAAGMPSSPRADEMVDQYRDV